MLRVTRHTSQVTRHSSLVTLALIAWLVGLAAVQAAAPGSSTRSGPATYRPGQTIVLTNQLAPLGSIWMYSLSEAVPAGWTFKAASDGGTYSAPQNRISWLFFDHQVRQVTFSLQAPGDATGPVALQGEASFNGESVGVGGTVQIALEPPPSGAVKRQLPAMYSPGAAIDVTLAVRPEPGVSVYGVEETVPAGWTVSSIGGGGNQPSPGVLQWGPFLDDNARSCSYSARAPATATGDAVFHGTGSFDSAVVATGGAGTVALAPATQGSVTRQLPAQYSPGGAFTVVLEAKPSFDTAVYAVSETPPSGWLVTNISNFGGIPAGSATIRWGPFLDNVERTLTYQVTPPATASGAASFTGLGEFDSATFPIGGATNVAWVPLESGVVTRVLPDFCRPGEAFWVTNLVVPNEQVSVQGIEETLPAGWVVTDPGLGAYLPASHSLRFGPYLDHEARQLAYQLTPPANAAGTVVFAGTGTFGTTVVAIGGRSDLAVRLPVAGTASRWLPPAFRPGVAFGVTNVVQPDGEVGLYAVEEVVPAGWSAAGANEGGAFDAAASRLRWGPFTDAQPRQLTYQLLSPASVRGVISLAGTASFDGQTVSVGGQTEIAANAPPEVSEIADLASYTDAPVVVSFLATDYETPASNLVVTASSSDPGVVPEGSLALGWIGAARSLTIAPQTEQGGATTITVSASDGANTASRSFQFTVYLPARLKVPPADQTVLAGATATFSVTATGSPPLSYQWQFKGTNLPGATGTTLVLSNVAPSQAGQYRVRVSNTTGSATSEAAALTVNQAPVAVGDSAATAPNKTARLLGAKLLRNDWDLDGEDLTIIAVSPESARGGTVELSEGNVFYTPPAGFTGTDHFTYTISDERAATAVGTVTVQVAVASVPVRMVPPVVQPGGVMLLEFRAIPGRTYIIEASTNLTIWATITQVVANNQGMCRFVDTAAPQYPGRYYRSRKP